MPIPFSKIDPRLRICCTRRGARQRLTLVLRAAFFVAFAVVLPAALRAGCSQAFETPGPDCYANLSRAKLVGKDMGWAIVSQPVPDPPHQPSNRGDCVSEHLYWTENNGKTWREITPGRMPTKNLGMLCFFIANTVGQLHLTLTVTTAKTRFSYSPRKTAESIDKFSRYSVRRKIQ